MAQTDSSTPATKPNQRVSYTITINRKVTWEKTTTENMVTHEEPSTVKQQRSYGSGEEVVMIRQFAPQTKVETVAKEEQVYQQTVDALNLVAVINAVNAGGVA